MAKGSIEKAVRERIIALYADILKGRKPTADARSEIAALAATKGINETQLSQLQNLAIDRTEDPNVRRRRYRGHRPHYQV